MSNFRKILIFKAIVMLLIAINAQLNVLDYYEFNRKKIVSSERSK